MSQTESKWVKTCRKKSNESNRVKTNPVIFLDDPFAEFGNDFMGEDFEDMDRQDRLHNNLEAGFDKWEDRCLRVGGKEALDQWLAAQENLVYCVMQNFNINSIQNEIEEKKRTGDLDLVFKKYCG